PTGERIRLVVTDMADRLEWLQRLEPGQRELRPAAVPLLPIQRRYPAVGLPRRPAVGEPKLRALIAAVGYEFQVPGVGDQPLRQLERMQILPMAGRLIVEGKCVALMSDFNKLLG